MDKHSDLALDVTQEKILPHQLCLSPEEAMLDIAPDDLLSFAKRLDGKQLRTLHEGKPFGVRFDGETLVFTPASTGNDRPHQRPYVENVCARFRETNSLHPGDYKDGTYNASYTLTLIAAYLGAIAQGEFDPSVRQTKKTTSAG